MLHIVYHHYIPAETVLVTMKCHTYPGVQVMSLKSRRVLISPNYGTFQNLTPLPPSQVFFPWIPTMINKAFSQLYLMSFAKNVSFKNLTADCISVRFYILEGSFMSNFQPRPLWDSFTCLLHFYYQGKYLCFSMQGQIRKYFSKTQKEELSPSMSAWDSPQYYKTQHVTQVSLLSEVLPIC